MNNVAMLIDRIIMITRHFYTCTSSFVQMKPIAKFRIYLKTFLANRGCSLYVTPIYLSTRWLYRFLTNKCYGKLLHLHFAFGTYI